MAAAGVLAVAAIISQHPETPSNSGDRAGPRPQIEFVWSVPNKPYSSAQVAIRGSELQNEITPDRRSHKQREAAVEHQQVKRQHGRSEPANISASVVSEGTSPATASPKRSATNEIATVEQRLRNSLSDELFADFQLFLYVSKAAEGPLAQQMYVFRKKLGGALDFLYDWPVSTGRERAELNDQGVELSSFTPAGYFKLDPQRFYRHHTSAEWGEPMPFAMFFDWVKSGTPTGLAIHAATGSDIAALGKRASAGCIRLSPQNAETLFTLVRTQYRGLTPRFATDHRTGTMSNDGTVLRDANGRAEMTQGYRVLVVIENYGGENLVAAMY